MSGLRDRYGLTVTTASPTARDAYVAAVDRLLSGGTEIAETFAAAIAADEGFALAHIGLARANQVLGRGAEVAAPLARAIALAAGTTPRERSHVAIFEKILTGQGTAAIPMIREHAATWPRDAMTLAPATSVFGLIAFSGRAGREAEQLALLEPLADAYGDDWWFRTVLAFAEIELQLHDRGRRNIDAALRGNPRSAHAAHIKGHLFYELGEREAGLAYLGDWARDYPPAGQLHCHVSWHLAVWSLETGREADAWAVYRRALRPGGAWGPPINVLTDCASFLLRAEIAGAAVPAEAWGEIGAYAASTFPNSGVTFADIHSALAFAMSGDEAALRRIRDTPKGPAADMTAAIAEGFGAFARRDWARAAEALIPVLDGHERVGGSRAQRDLLEYAVAHALLHTRGAAEARRHIAARRPANSREGFPIAGL